MQERRLYCPLQNINRDSRFGTALIASNVLLSRPRGWDGPHGPDRLCTSPCAELKQVDVPIHTTIWHAVTLGLWISYFKNCVRHVV